MPIQYIMYILIYKEESHYTTKPFEINIFISRSKYFIVKKS